jgi:hypothetical protein
VIATNIIQSTRFDATGRADGDVEGRRAQFEKMFRQRRYGPEKVAKAILTSVKKKKPLRPVAPEAYLLYGTSRIAPQALRNTARLKIV